MPVRLSREVLLTPGPPVPLWLVLTTPWIAIALFVAFRVRLPPDLPPASETPAPPLVSVIIPARDEALNIRRVLETVSASTWPRFEIVVVDDGSTDGTGELARSVDPGRAERVEVIDGKPLPDGWMGKPWACCQGARRARGDLLLFTDADTVHGPDLMSRSVAALQAEGADVVTVAGRQIMGTFWERLVQPQIFMTMIFRYPDTSRPVPRRRWRDAIANGQYMLFRKEVYREMGGHEAVRDEVAEDLRLAQILVREGYVFRTFMAEDALATRMYRSLRELVAGWSKNVIMGGLATLPPVVRFFALPIMLLVGPILWLVPPLVLVAGAAGIADPLLAWAAVVVAVSAAFWCRATARFGASWAYGLLYPLGAAVGWWIFLRAAVRMRRVEWKGRTYRAELPSE